MTENIYKSIDVSDEKGKEMKMYAFMSYLESLRNYDNIKQDNENQSLAKFLHDNNLSEEEQRSFVAKCLTPIEIKKILLRYELKYYKPVPSECNLKQFAKTASELLRRYQCKAGGFEFEDVDWIVHDKSSSEYGLKKEDLWFENSINRLDQQNDEVIDYMDKLKEKLSLINPMIKVEYYFQNTKNTCLVFIKCQKETKKETKKVNKKKNRKNKKLKK